MRQPLNPMESKSESDFVKHNESRSRFEIALGEETAFADYRVEGDQMIFTHTEVPQQFRGRGIAHKLVLAGFDVASKKRLQVVPLCSYVARVLQEHPEFHGLPETRDNSR
jgi:predicted GNAT family acetyltransferase